MHKSKPDSTKLLKIRDSRAQEAGETQNEENYEAIGGETSTEGVGRGFDSDGPDASPNEKAESSADGPMSGEQSDPPSQSPKKKKPRQNGVQRADNRSNHAAANNTKSI